MRDVARRLQLIVNASSSGRQLPHTLSASFNGQTLSNLVEAYDTANMLTPELLQAIFDVAAYRLGRPSSGVQGLRGFKPEVRCTHARLLLRFWRSCLCIPASQLVARDVGGLFPNSPYAALRSEADGSPGLV